MQGRVLCADGDPQSCAILRDSLLAQGYEVETQHDGNATSECIADSLFDLALLDTGLPSRDGFELLEEIRRQASPMCDIPVFLLTPTRVTRADHQRARQGGATAMLVKPVPLPRLHGLIRKHVKEGPPRVRSTERAPIPSRSSPFDGSFLKLDFASLLHHLHGLRASGALLVTNAGRRKVLQLREGYPVSVKSNLLGECLGNLLVDQGRISREVFDESVERMKAGEGLQGEILVAMQVMEEDEVGRVLVEQAEEKLLEIFSWRRGRYEFRPGAQLKGGIALPRDRSPALWLLRGVLERMPVEAVDLRLQRLADRALGVVETPFYRLQEIELGDAAQTVLDILDGDEARSVRDWLRAEEAVRRALYGLIATGLVETLAVPHEQTRRRSSPGPRASSRVDERALRAELAATAERMRRQDDFEVLGIAPGADTAEIETAFGEVAARWHPDRFQGHSGSVRALADRVFARVESAFDRLREPRARGEYVLELRQGERKRARAKEEERALEAEVEFQKGEELLRARSYQAALLCFGNALERVPQEGVFHAHYGWCLYLIHSEESAMVHEAIEHVKRGVKLARDQEKPYLFLGRLYKATGNAEAAEKMFTRAVQIRPESVEALRELRLIHLRRSRQGLIGRILRR